MSPSPISGQPDPATSPISSVSPPRGRAWRRFRARLRIWRLRMRAHPVLYWTWCGAVGLIGGTILVAGLVMSVTPGPGMASIILGLAVLATEFAWARGLLRFARDWARRTRDLAVETRRRRRAHKKAASEG